MFGSWLRRIPIPTDVVSRVRFWLEADRLGPDIALTHWQLHFKSTMRKLCKRRFKRFGDGAEFRAGAYAEACSKISIGNRVIVRPGSFLFADPAKDGAGIFIADDVLLGPSVYLYTNNHEFSKHDTPIIEQGYPESTLLDSIYIERGAWIGANVVILPGVTIGANSVVGAGSVVTKSVPPGVVVAGNPAQMIKDSNE